MRREHVRLACLALLACMLLACENKKARKPLPDWSGHYEEDAGLVDAGKHFAAGGFSIVVPDDVEYPHRLYEEGNTSAPCAVTLGDDAHNDIRCMLDMDELNLFVLGFKLDIVTPVGGCDFVLYEPYMYSSWPVGPGPTKVAYTKHADGTFSNEVNSANGVPICDTDFSRLVADGPNCCTGNYELTVTSAESGESSMSEGNWGGGIAYADCFDGAGWMLKDPAAPLHGFPPDPIYYVDRKDQVIHLEEQGFSARYNYNDPVIRPTSVQLANYWDDSDGQPPRGLSDPLTRPDYTFTCYDDAEEILARIRLQVREWNEEVQFDTIGNPDTEGTELKFPSPAPSPVNDIFDWKDIAKMGSDHDFVSRIPPRAATVEEPESGGNGGQQ